mmetsp:Transcript_22677/g.73117  ORF Transcript_22677/g.73117 Transcript_22677/m.73117 type:complete len:207 (+) Transcript_22677:541-1161(+)
MSTLVGRDARATPGASWPTSDAVSSAPSGSKSHGVLATLFSGCSMALICSLRPGVVRMVDCRTAATFHRKSRLALVRGAATAPAGAACPPPSLSSSSRPRASCGSTCAACTASLVSWLSANSIWYRELAGCISIARRSSSSARSRCAAPIRRQRAKCTSACTSGCPSCRACPAARSRYISADTASPCLTYSSAMARWASASLPSWW